MPTSKREIINMPTRKEALEFEGTLLERYKKLGVIAVVDPKEK